jgi:hypothetical protein
VLGGYGAVIKGSGNINISGGVKNNKVIYNINKNTSELGGGALLATGGAISISGDADGNSVDFNAGDGEATGIGMFGGIIKAESTASSAVAISGTALNNVVNLTGGDKISGEISAGCGLRHSGRQRRGHMV